MARRKHQQGMPRVQLSGSDIAAVPSRPRTFHREGFDPACRYCRRYSRGCGRPVTSELES